jgi:ABC-type uncharacterized transport system auxiliary subunit
MRRGHALPLLFAAATGACAPAGEIPPDRFYRVSLAATEVPRRDIPLATTIVVERPAAEGLLVGRPIVYSAGEDARELGEYRYDYWAVPPPVMVRDVLVDCLEESNVAKRIVTDSHRLSGDVSVLGNLQRLEHRIATPPKAIVEIKLGIVDNKNNRLVNWKTYRAEAEAAETSIVAAIDAFSGAFTDICRNFTADIAARTLKSLRK